MATDGYQGARFKLLWCFENDLKTSNENNKIDIHFTYVGISSYVPLFLQSVTYTWNMRPDHNPLHSESRYDNNYTFNLNMLVYPVYVTYMPRKK